ncbi:hypothetical protein CCACVL1_02262 [Corchorus capsularis]|uniref:Uncharacterized protein n=1 Tax=Corchorus capsularis TaxID=210143 RepID=A0A1R3K9K9_COCAP|nr:hypothetical protein CCACVL1_02931 [Corchorus capsularis]OMP03790.1 hypothetical protein CCACVL1_02262 [Corchorus capsularis]
MPKLLNRIRYSIDRSCSAIAIGNVLPVQNWGIPPTARRLQIRGEETSARVDKV